MPDPHRPSDRTAAQRQADHAGLARLSDTLVPALVAKLTGSGLGELEVREGDWKIRLRRPAGAATPRRDRQRTPGHGGGPGGGGHAAGRASSSPATPADPTRTPVTAPAVGVFRRVAPLGGRVRSGDRVGIVDLLGIPQDVVSPSDGILVDYLVETGDAVEYGEEVALVAEPVIDREGGQGGGAGDEDQGAPGGAAGGEA